MVEAKRVHVLACGVLATDLRVLASRLPELRLTLDFLPGRLHETPGELRRRLQERIDAVSAAGSADIIAIAYGLCGRGSAGLQARSVPLRIACVHDCIALFLGSDAAYREQFSSWPGTYYVSAGWVNEGMGSGVTCRTVEQETWTATHGAENAAAIADFLGSWRRNYQRAAFIDTGIGDTHHARIAEEMARANGWRYERLQGSHALLETLLRDVPDLQILDVPPGHVTVFDAVARHLAARPAAAAAGEAPAVASAPPTRSVSDPGGPRRGLGLGIDAGGTYTDAVLFDAAARRVVAKAKAPTTHWDYAEGIDAALAQLPPARFADVTRVSVSTTLATNAIVEGKGQRVGLLLMPPAGDDVAAHLHHRPLQVVRGRLGIDGQELEPPDVPAAVAAARDMAAHHGVRAFAVTGYASPVNPAHELAIREAVRAATGLPVTCGHEVSSILDYRVRAETAALNARIVPCLEALMNRLRDVLAARGIAAPIMVVRSDGSLMGLAMALERPVETLLSGPAASMAGARFLSEAADALVIDIGGTTSDTAVLHGGEARTDPDGATVGPWRTHVRALAVRTLGLGGDSEVRRDRHSLHVGPQRVNPLCRLAEAAGAAAAARVLARLAAEANDDAPDGLAVYVRTSAAFEHPSPRQQAVLDELARGPRTLRELVAATGCLRASFLELGPLQERAAIRRFAFTPTDALHVLGRLALWDREAACRLAAAIGAAAGQDAQAFAVEVVESVVRRAARELLLTRLADLAGPQAVAGEHGTVARALLDRGVGACRDGLGVDLRLGVPVIGIGAPAGFFLPDAGARLHAETILPRDGDVANALGAIVSGIRVERRATILADERGVYRVQGVAGAPAFAKLSAAQAHAEQALCALVADLARAAGAPEPEIAVSHHDRITQAADGLEVFLARDVIARATGEPG